MLQITPQMKILVAVAPADFRKGIDGLVRLCKDSLGQDPFAGAVFVMIAMLHPCDASLAAHQLSVLFSAGNPDQTGAAPDWRPVGPRS